MTTRATCFTTPAVLIDQLVGQEDTRLNCAIASSIASTTTATGHSTIHVAVVDPLLRLAHLIVDATAAPARCLGWHVGVDWLDHHGLLVGRRCLLHEHHWLVVDLWLSRTGTTR